jgi:copper chaperone NosL
VTLNNKVPNPNPESFLGQAPGKFQAPSAKYSVIAALIASGLLLVSLKLPLWHMRLEAPQYRDEEALKIAVHPNAMKGDLRELKVLNQYIGVHVPPTLPQFKWLPWAITVVAILGIGTSFIRGTLRKTALVILASSLTAALVFAAVQAHTQMHDIGHKRDQKTVLVGMHDFTPPFLGTTKIAQFTVSSRFGAGAWLIGTALFLQIAAAWLTREPAPAGVEALEKAIDSQSPPSYVSGYKTFTI